MSTVARTSTVMCGFYSNLMFYIVRSKQKRGGFARVHRNSSIPQHPCENRYRFSFKTSTLRKMRRLIRLQVSHG